jgi:hypothetical protein
LILDLSCSRLHFAPPAYFAYGLCGRISNEELLVLVRDAAGAPGTSAVDYLLARRDAASV